jgi:predicted CopG family antitoxin
MTKIISLSDQVYLQLVKLKKERSFSKTIAELLDKNSGNGDISKIKKLFGTIDKKRTKAWIKEIEAGRSSAGKSRVF